MINIARPRVYNADHINTLMEEYIANTDQPFIQEFCLIHDISDDTIDRLSKENIELSGTVKKLIKKQELYILQNASTGKINPVFGIFRLKQKCFGYTDKAELDITATPGLPDRSQLQAELQNLLAELPPEQRQFLLSSGE